MRRLEEWYVVSPEQHGEGVYRLLRGLVHDDPRCEDGKSRETELSADAAAEEGSIVTTASGSQYLLGAPMPYDVMSGKLFASLENSLALWNEVSSLRQKLNAQQQQQLDAQQRLAAEQQQLDAQQERLATQEQALATREQTLAAQEQTLAAQQHLATQQQIATAARSQADSAVQQQQGAAPLPPPPRQQRKKKQAAARPQQAASSPQQQGGSPSRNRPRGRAPGGFSWDGQKGAYVGAGTRPPRNLQARMLFTPIRGGARGRWRDLHGGRAKQEAEG